MWTAWYNPGMKFRKLRIAWSVFWGLACVLLIVLWVRSYWWVDMVSKTTTTSSGWRVCLFSGRLSARWGPGWRPINKLHWALSRPIEETPAYPSDDVLGFSLRRGYFSIPIWCAAVMSGLLAPIPWWLSKIPWSRRFSLRTLLIATTLVAVLL